MARTVKIAISLPKDILDDVEREIKRSGESRSQFFRRAVEMLFKERRERLMNEQYISGYQRMPEARKEVEAVRLAANIILAEESWE